MSQALMNDSKIFLYQVNILGIYNHIIWIHLFVCNGVVHGIVAHSKILFGIFYPRQLCHCFFEISYSCLQFTYFNSSTLNSMTPSRSYRFSYSIMYAFIRVYLFIFFKIISIYAQGVAKILIIIEVEQVSRYVKSHFLRALYIYIFVCL